MQSACQCKKKGTRGQPSQSRLIAGIVVSAKPWRPEERQALPAKMMWSGLPTFVAPALSAALDRPLSPFADAVLARVRLSAGG